MAMNFRRSGFPARDLFLYDCNACGSLLRAGGAGCWGHAKPRRSTQRTVFGVRRSGEPRTVVRGWLFRSSGFPARDLLSATGCVGIAVAGRGGQAGGLTRSRAGRRTLVRGDWCAVLPDSPFHFLQSTLYGMDAIAPSPPTPLPRFTGARGVMVGQSGRTSEKKRIQLPCMMAVMSVCE